MPTSFTFLSQYVGRGTGIGASGGSADGADVTITAVVDDGVIGVGDQVTATGINPFLETESGISNGTGTPFTFIGTGTFNGVTGFVFTSDGALTNPDQILVLTNETSPTSPTQIDVRQFSTDTSTQTLTSDPACFLAGTMITTPDGEVPVESLQIGQVIMNTDGEAMPVKWVGRQTLHKLSHSAAMQPVCIQQGALGNGLPTRDLKVTADHGVLVEGYVINASALVNHTSITFVPMDDLEESFVVYHVETEGHQVILANGAPSETFVDYVTRQAFDNYDEYLALYGADRIIREMPRPRVSSARLLPEQIKARLGLTEVALDDRASAA